MLFAEITIKIKVDESKLTTQQRREAEQSDVDVSMNHPAGFGVSLVSDHLEEFVKSQFRYLHDGREAVSIEIIG